MPDGMFTDEFLGGQGMNDLINYIFALICHSSCTHNGCVKDTISNGIGARWDEEGFPRDAQNQINVPDFKNLRERIIRLRHDARLGGHRGQARTYEAVSRDYYWPGMKADIAEYVRTITYV